jgi:hypothetical protein
VAQRGLACLGDFSRRERTFMPRNEVKQDTGEGWGDGFSENFTFFDTLLTQVFEISFRSTPTVI